MIGDEELPAGWCGSYGTLNVRQALLDIHARLYALERCDASLPEQPRSAVMISRQADGHFEGKHVTVFYTEPLSFNEAYGWLGLGRHVTFVRPQDAGLLLDVLEAERHAHEAP